MWTIGDCIASDGEANQTRATQVRHPSATPRNCSTREIRAASTGLASVRSFAAGHPIRAAGRSVLSPRRARAAVRHIQPRSPSGARPRGHAGRRLLNREPCHRSLHHLPAQLVPALHGRPAGKAAYTRRQGLVSRAQLPRPVQPHRCHR